MDAEPKMKKPMYVMKAMDEFARFATSGDKSCLHGNDTPLSRIKYQVSCAAHGREIELGDSKGVLLKYCLASCSINRIQHSDFDFGLAPVAVYWPWPRQCPAQHERYLLQPWWRRSPLASDE